MTSELIDVLSVVWIKYVLDISVISVFMYIVREKKNKNRNHQ